MGRPTKKVTMLPSGKRVAYTTIPCLGGDGTLFGVGLCVEGEQGYRMVSTYVPKVDESHIDGIVDRLNSRLGISKVEASKILISTMRRQTPKKKAA